MTSSDDVPEVCALLPDSPDFDDIYARGIRAACVAAGVRCERVDQQLFDETSLARVYGRINSADLIVADLTGRDPNVFYETGFAHAMGKVVILLVRDARDIPFDLHHYPHIVHEGQIEELRNELMRRVKWFLDQPRRARQNQS